METIKMIPSLLILLRPNHYVKNLFVLLPLFFSAMFTDEQLMWNAFEAFVCFCLMASSVYIFNDIHDVEEDRIHPLKQDRPIAAGVVSVSIARLLDLLFTTLSLILAWSVNLQVVYVLVIYKIINILYTLVLKKMAILDIMVLSIGFVLRLFAGSVSTGVVLSEWIIIMTFLFSLLIVLGKRRHDVLFFEEKEVLLRKAVSGYNTTFLNYAMMMLSSIIIVAYTMYTVSPVSEERFGTHYLFLTVFWVIAGVFRYIQLLFVFETHDPPVKLLYKDHPLKIILLAWVLNFIYFIYVS